jgi:hypothetical protein
MSRMIKVIAPTAPFLRALRIALLCHVLALVFTSLAHAQANVATPRAQGPENLSSPLAPPRCTEDSQCPPPALAAGELRECVKPQCDNGECTKGFNTGATLTGQTIPDGVVCYAHPQICDSAGRPTPNTAVKISANQGNSCQPSTLECEEYKCDAMECKRFPRDRTPCVNPSVVASVCQVKLCANYICSPFADPGKAGTKCGEPQTSNCLTTPRQCALNGSCTDGTPALAANAQCARGTDPSGPSIIIAPPDRLPETFRTLFVSSQTFLYSCNAQCVLEYCGDGVLNGDEECDGTAFKSGFSADATCNQNTCKVESCGDGMITGTEDCDGAGMKSGFPKDATCNQTTCKAEYCGDGALNVEKEECDGTLIKPGFPQGATCNQPTCRVNVVNSCNNWPPPPSDLSCQSDKDCWVEEPDKNLCEDCWECNCDNKDAQGNCASSGEGGFCKVRSAPHTVDPLRECPQALAIEGDQVSEGAVCIQTHRVPSCDPSSGCMPGEVTTSAVDCCQGQSGAALAECQRCTECQFVTPDTLYSNPLFQQTLTGARFDFLRNTDWSQGIGGNRGTEKPLVPSCVKKPECGGPPPPPPPSTELLPPPPPPPPGPGVDCSDHRISQCVRGAPFMKDCGTSCCKTNTDGPCVMCQMAVNCPASLEAGKCVFVCPRGATTRLKTGCFGADTQILTPRGYVPISKLLRGDFVIDPSTGSAVEIAELVVGPEKEALYEITTASGASLRVTVHHPMPLASGEIVTASKVRVGDVLKLGPDKIPDRIVLVERNGGNGELVWNLAVDRTTAGNVGYVVADGIITGDLAHQRALQEGGE